MSSSNVVADGSAFDFAPADRLHSFLSPTVWSKITPLSQQHKAINLGQGFPGFSPPEFVRETLSSVVKEEGENTTYLVNQYTRIPGDFALVNSLAVEYTGYLGREINPIANITVSNGATGILFNVAQAFLNPGDEVVVFEPAFDIYQAQAVMAGGVVKFVPLVMEEINGENKWTFDINVFKSKLSAKTRLVILNTPHNPTGKVFTKDELISISAAIAPFPRIIIAADEVYQHLVFDTKHIHIASITYEDYKHLLPTNTEEPSVDPLPQVPADKRDMFHRTLSVCSSGKTLATTGWKIGWAVGPENLVSCINLANSWVTFSVNTPCQVAIGRCFEQIRDKYTNYYQELVDEYKKRYNIISEALTQLNIPFAAPEGSFFIVADVSSVKIPEEYLKSQPSRDWAFSIWAIEVGGVATIPCSVFYSEENRHTGENLVRIAFAQSIEAMNGAADRLKKLIE